MKGFHKSSYQAPCPRCGQYVWHSWKHKRPFHMHWWSKKCREQEAKRSVPFSAGWMAKKNPAKRKA